MNLTPAGSVIDADQSERGSHVPRDFESMRAPRLFWQAAAALCENISLARTTRLKLMFFHGARLNKYSMTITSPAESESKYDVAISFLARDEPTAAGLSDLLDGLEVCILSS